MSAPEHPAIRALDNLRTSADPYVLRDAEIVAAALEAEVKARREAEAVVRDLAALAPEPHDPVLWPMAVYRMAQSARDALERR